ncbi:MAG: polysaccharide biosynthesis/export family protein [Acidobacteriota bacterium]
MSKTFVKFGIILSCILIADSGLRGQAPVPGASRVAAAKDASAGLPSKTTVVGNQPGGPVEAGKADNNNSRRENLTEEEAAILPYYNNYLREYHLGPEDVISVEVFGQSNYSKTGIMIPPTSRISYPLIPGGVFVGGKTVEQVADDIRKGLDEYIIDPQVMVTLDKVGSARFSVLGKVGTPGIKPMNRRYNLVEAISEAGGIEKEGDKKRVLLVRLAPGGGFTQTVVDVGKVMVGKAQAPYLVPGDQVIVPEKRWSLSKIVEIVGKASSLRILFGVPF